MNANLHGCFEANYNNSNTMKKIGSLGFALMLAGVLSCMAFFPRQHIVSRVIIVDGFSNHDWRQTSAVVKWLLEGTGRFEVTVTTIPLDSGDWALWDPDFEPYDVVIQNTNNIHQPKLVWPKHAQRKLEEFVQKGGGLYILHSANNAFPDWEEYNKMIGLGWRSADRGVALEVDAQRNVVRHERGEGKGTSHGARFDALIQVINRHPINQDYPDAWKTVNTEVYSFPRGHAENLTILSSAYDSTDTRKVWPVEWVVSYGKGRVYNSSMGHLWHGEVYPESYRCVGFQTTVIRAVEWLATGAVSYPLPDDFPDKENSSLRPAGEFTFTSGE
jgi:type 1 glutamine amidotransferase